MASRNPASSSPTTTRPEPPGRGAATRGDGVVGGYRVVRRAADRHGGRVCTGHADSKSVEGVEGDGRTAVSIVTFDENVAGAHAMRLVEMLDRLAGPAVPRVIDVADDESHGPVVVLEYCGDTVASILADGTGITAGEVVTIVAPILSAVVSLHDRGYAHGGLSVASIAIGAGGKPLLLGVERAVELVGDVRDRERTAGDDIRRIADLLSELADAVRDPTDRRRVIEAGESIRSAAAAPFSPASVAAAEVRVFEIARPTALVLASPPERSSPDGRVTPPVVRAERRRRPLTDERRRPPIDAITRLIAAVRERIVVLSAGRRPDSPARRRRGPIVLGAGIVIATVLVLILLPTERNTSSGATEPGGRPSGARGELTDGAHADEATASGEGSAEPRAEKSNVTNDVSSEDVVVGARAVLDGVAACAVSTADDDCWASVVEPGTALSDELAASDDPIGELPDALALPVDAVELRPRDDYGDARVVLVTPSDGTRPASVLMIRTEAGWRLRDAFDA